MSYIFRCFFSITGSPFHSLLQFIKAFLKLYDFPLEYGHFISLAY